MPLSRPAHNVPNVKSTKFTKSHHPILQGLHIMCLKSTKFTKSHHPILQGLYIMCPKSTKFTKSLITPFSKACT